MKSRREASKCREWEKVRRDKLSKSFTILSKLLPNHDPSLTLSKIEILHKATAYIEELQQKLKDVLTPDGVKTTEREEIKALYERIKKLLTRNEQLSNLLKDAGIRIPSEYGSIKNFKEPLRWSNKITPEQAKKLVEKEAQKENEKETNVAPKQPNSKLKNLKKATGESIKRKKDAKTSKKLKSKKSAIISVQLSNAISTQLNHTKPSPQPCFIITSNSQLPQNCRTRKSASTVVTNSSSLAAPKMASIITPPTTTIVPKANSSLSSLGPGTLILANGNIVPILPQPTILTNPTPILLKPSTNNTTLIVVPTKTKEITTSSSLSTAKSTVSSTSSSSTTPIKTFARIRPKIGVTRTTQANKVPIPALTSHYSALLTQKNDMSQEKRAKKAAVKVKKPLKRKLLNLSNLEVKRPTVDEATCAVDVVEGGSKIVAEPIVNDDSKQSKTEHIVTAEKCSVEIGVALETESDKKKGGGEESVIEVPQKDADIDQSIDENAGGTLKVTTTSSLSVVNKDTVVVDVSVAELHTNGVELPNAVLTESIAQTAPINDPKRIENNLTDHQKHTSDTLQSIPSSKIVEIASTSSITTTTSTVSIAPIDAEIQDKNLELGMNLNHSELSNDIFSSLQVPIGGQNPESTSPTAAFLLAFPLVSSLTGVKVTEVIEEENSDSRHGTPTLLQIGTMDTTKTTQSMHNESLTPNLLNLDNFSFFSGNNFYSSFDNSANLYPTASACAQVVEGVKNPVCVKEDSVKQPKVACEPVVQPKLQKEVVPEVRVPQTSSTAIMADAQVTKVQNFVRQNTSVSYSKLPSASVTSSYVHNTHMHYDARQKPSTTAPTCKDMNVVRKNPELTQYNAATVAQQCNAFNPFSDFSKPNTTVHSYATFSKPYGDPLYTNSTHYNYPQHNGNFEQAYYPPKSAAKPNTYPTPNYADASYTVDCKTKRHNPATYYNQSKVPAKQTKGGVKPNNQPKPPINWMTSDFRAQPSNTDYLLPPFSKDIEYNPNSFYSSSSFASTTHAPYFNATSTMYATPEFQENRKTFDPLPIISSTSSAQRGEFEENQFSWSPTKLPQFLEAPHGFVSSTLPTLVGDLALGTTQTASIDQANAKAKDRRSKVHTAVNYDNQSNFLSVSQLVESKSDMGGSARAANRRNTANRTTKGNAKPNKHKVTDSKELEGFNAKLDTTDKVIKQNPQNITYSMQTVDGSTWAAECNKPNRHVHKNPQSSYSAEALIGHQEHSDSAAPKQRYRQQQTNYGSVNKTIPIPSFLSDNIVPYFPPVEIPQDNNFMQTNPNYQTGSLTHTFPASVQNNTYPSGTYISTGATITSNYLPIPEFTSTHEFSAIPDNTIDKLDNKHCTRSEPIKSAGNRAEERPNLSQQIGADCSANFVKKTKHKHVGEANNVPGIVDFGFLSMPSTINSPILPDDFHAHSNFLPPPTPSQLYPCKNPLYTKQSSDLLPLPPVPVSRSAPQHFEGSSTVGNVGSSLTSFNLSAIFPEINKGAVPLPGLYSEPSRNKNYNFQRNYLGSSVQVSFSNKSTASTSYVNSVATTYAASN